MEKDYPEYHRHLGGLIKDLRVDIPATLAGFYEMHRGALARGPSARGRKS